MANILPDNTTIPPAAHYKAGIPLKLIRVIDEYAFTGTCHWVCLFNRLYAFHFKSHWNHVQAVIALGSLVGKISRNEDPDLPSILTDELTGNTRVVEPLRFEVLAMK